MKRLLLLGVLLSLVAIGACSTDGPSPTAVADAPASDTDVETAAQALPTAAQRPAASVTSTPFPLSIDAIESVLTFSTAFDQVTEKWDGLHEELDIWRHSLIACDASAARSALSRFAGLAADLTTEARGLPRSPYVRAMADSLIAATAGQEGAYRDLRDNWRPDAEAIFGAVEVERSHAASARNQTQDTLIDLLRTTSLSSRNSVLGFSAALADINVDWDRLHAEYNGLRGREAELTSLELVSELSGLVVSFSAIAVQIRGLTYDATTAAISRIVSEAADNEELALRNLRNAFEKFDPIGANGAQSFSDESAPPSTTGPAGVSGEDAVQGQDVSFVTSQSDQFRVFGAQLVVSNAARRHAQETLAEVLREVSLEARAQIEEFEVEHRSVTEAWDSFDEEYLVWRRTEGGCDSTTVIETLGGFSTDFSALARRVRALPSVPPLLSLGEIFVEAVNREESALRDLRDNWRPFDSGIYNELETQRIAVAKLRRQVAAGLANILAQYQIRPPDSGM